VKPRAKIASIIPAADSLGVSALLGNAVASAKMERDHHRELTCILTCAREEVTREQSCPRRSPGPSCSFPAPSQAVLPNAMPRLSPSSDPSLSQCTSLTQKKTIQCFILCWVHKLNQLSAGWQTKDQDVAKPGQLLAGHQTDPSHLT